MKYACIFLAVLPVVLTAQPANPFAEYAGEWKGIFYTYSPDGRLINSLEAHHVYKIVNSYTLEGTQRIRYRDGTFENVHAVDTVEGGKLYCRVQSDRFGKKVLEGRVEGNQIFWWRHDKDAIESYRERILDSGKIYAIDGYGIYGTDRNKIYTFFAEYRRVR